MQSQPESKDLAIIGIKIIAILMGFCLWLCLFVMPAKADEVQDYINGLIGKNIDVYGLYDDYGFVGELIAVQYNNGIVLRIKGIIQKSKTDSNFWKSIESRSDAQKLISDDSSKEAVVIDAVLAGGDVELREYDGYDKETDYFVSRIKPLNVSDILVKAIIVQRADESKLDILIQDKSSNDKFRSLLKELRL